MNDLYQREPLGRARLEEEMMGNLHRQRIAPRQSSRGRQQGVLSLKVVRRKRPQMETRRILGPRKTPIWGLGTGWNYASFARMARVIDREWLSKLASNVREPSATDTMLLIGLKMSLN